MQLSVVITVVDGVEAVARCLRALATQESPPPMEVLIPYDDSVDELGRLARDFPEFRFLDLGTLETRRPKSSPAGQHELFDRRRAAGLRSANGDLVAILEDRGVPRANWARTAVELHRLPHAVIGGAIENGRDQLLNWAVYFCDFSRYQLPFTAGARSYVSDVNICYKREALERTRQTWADRYHETTVHWALQRAGMTLFLSPELIVDQVRERLTLGRLLHERFHWGRLFAYTRGRESTLSRRLGLAALSPLLPAALLLRHARLQVRKRVALGWFFAAAPVVALLLIAWSAGELWGYLTGQP